MALPPPESTPADSQEYDWRLLLEMYRRMLLIRRFEEAAVRLNRAGEIPGAIHCSNYQEATVVGACLAVRRDDYMTGNHRSHGHPIAKGADVRPLMAELLGKATGVCKGKGGSMHLADFSVGSLGESGIVASAMPVAVGAGLSASVRGTDQVCLCFFGDGASNAGAFHESLNLAAIWKLPVIFLCENNQWAATTSVTQSTSVEDIAERAGGYSIPGVVVDGQDPIAVYEAVAAAVARARRGEGPSLVEAKTYRMGEHAESLFTEVPYRDEAELEEWRERDPIALFVPRLLGDGLISTTELQALEDAVEAEIEEALAFARESPYPRPEAAFEDLYANPLSPGGRE